MSGLVGADVLLRLGDAGVVDAADHVRRHQGGQDAEDDHHDHDLDQGESFLRADGATCGTQGVVGGVHRV